MDNAEESVRELLVEEMNKELGNASRIWEAREQGSCPAAKASVRNGGKGNNEDSGDP